MDFDPCEIEFDPAALRGNGAFLSVSTGVDLSFNTFRGVVLKAEGQTQKTTGTQEEEEERSSSGTSCLFQSQTGGNMEIYEHAQQSRLSAM